MYTTPSMIRRTVAPSGLIATSSAEFYPADRTGTSRIPGEEVAGRRESRQRCRAEHGARDSCRHGLRRRAAERGEIGPGVPDGQAEEGVAVRRQMRWRERTLEALEAQPRHARGLGFAERGRRGDDADGGVDGTEAWRRRTGLEGRDGVHQSGAIGRVPCSGDEAARDGVTHVARGVDDHERGRDDAVPLHPRYAEAAAHGALDAVELAHGRARPGAHVAFL